MKTVLAKWVGGLAARLYPAHRGASASNPAVLATRPTVSGGAGSETARLPFAPSEEFSSEERLQQVVRVAGVGIFEHDHRTGAIYSSPEHRIIFGFSADELVTFGAIVARFHVDDKPEIMRSMEALQDPNHSGLFQIRNRIVRPDGEVRWVEARGVTLFEGAGADRRKLRTFGAVNDITARREAETALRRSEERLTQVLRSARIGVFEHDHITDVIHASPEHNAVWGFAPGAVVDLEGYMRRVHPDDLPKLAEAIDRGNRPGGHDTFDTEHRIIWPDGQVRWIQVRARTIYDESGNADGQPRRRLRTVGGVTDITEFQEAQDRLKQQATLLDEAQDAIVARGLDGRITYWNGGAERVYGWTAAEAIGRDGGELLQQDLALAKLVRERLMAVGEHTAIVPERCKDGRTVQMEGRFKLVRDEKGRPMAYFAIKTDVTRRLELENQLRQAQRLEAVGQLTGGVAHDFNNLLTVILGNTDLLAEHLSDQPRLLPLAEMARQAAQRGAELTHRLLAFARRQPLQPQAVSVSELLAGIESLLRRTLPANVELELVRGAGVWLALVDPAQLESAVLNLALNARDALPDGGKITLETANAHIDQDYADRHSEVSPGQYVLVSMSDTGCGMAPQQLARAFEPFFTTKAVGKGSGLGLSMVYGFVKQSRGHVKLYSEPGQGTTVRMYLPRSTEAVVAEPAARTVREQDFRGAATVLVVEDDELVRRFAQDVLARLGYTVVPAENGAVALEIFRGRDDIDLIFTDVVMPGGVNGRQLADAATALRPGTKVLFTSGYTENAIVHQGRLDRGVHLLPKPYRAVDLARKIWAVLA